jgi:hypothetical protein
MTDDLIKIVRTYRLPAGLLERLHLAEEIFRQVEPNLRLFVFSAIRPPAADDVLQEVLKAVATSMGKFAGETPAHGWGPCFENSPEADYNLLLRPNTAQRYVVTRACPHLTTLIQEVA